MIIPLSRANKGCLIKIMRKKSFWENNWNLLVVFGKLGKSILEDHDYKALPYFSDYLTQIQCSILKLTLRNLYLHNSLRVLLPALFCRLTWVIFLWEHKFPFFKVAVRGIWLKWIAATPLAGGLTQTVGIDWHLHLFWKMQGYQTFLLMLLFFAQDNVLLDTMRRGNVLSTVT